MPKSSVAPANLKASQCSKRRLPGWGWRAGKAGGHSGTPMAGLLYLGEQHHSWWEYFTVTVTSLLTHWTQEQTQLNSYSVAAKARCMGNPVLTGDLKYGSRQEFSTVVSFLIQKLLTLRPESIWIASSATSLNYIREISFPLPKWTPSIWVWVWV